MSVTTYSNSAGEWHREDGPAFIDTERGIEIWYKNGKQHRQGGPAYIDGGYSEDWIDGKLVKRHYPSLAEWK